MSGRGLPILLVGLLALPAWGQLGRVEDGRANDANLRVGSGGYNLPHRAQPRNYSNDIMSGNITAGRAFQGETQVGSTTDFGAPVGTDTLDNFRRDSVGVSDIRAGYDTYLPRPYYAPDKTVITSGGIRTGFEPFGVRRGPSYINMPLQNYGQRNEKTQPYSREIRILPRGDSPNIRTDTLSTGFRGPVDALDTRSALFGIAPNPSDVARMEAWRKKNNDVVPGTATFSRQTQQQPRQETFGTTIEPGQESGGNDKVAPVGSALDRLVNPSQYSGTAPPQATLPEQKGLPGSAYPSPQTQRPASFTREYTKPGEQSETEAALSPEQRPMSRLRRPGDVYDMMLDAASKTRDLVPPQPQDKQQSRAAALRAPGPEETRPQMPANQAAPPSTPSPGAYDRDAAELLAKPITTFVGSAKTMANEAFRRAEQNLAAGRYYDAVSAYDAARTADPNNPLIWIGRGHALIGAGDYLASAASLQQGLERFPQVARFNINLKAFLSQGDILDIRRADLEKRLERSEDYRLRFLLGYIEYYSGMPKFGLPDLERAAKEAPETSIIATFPKLLARGKTTTRP